MWQSSETMRKRLEQEGETDIERKYLRYPLLNSPEKNYYYDGESYWRVCRLHPPKV